MTTNHAPSKSSPASPPVASRASRAAWGLGGVGVGLALALAFGAGRWTSAPAPAGRREVRERPQAQATTAAERPSPWNRQVAARAVPQATGPAPEAAPPAGSSRAAVPPAQLAQYQSEVVTHVEEQRREVVSTCWPDEGLPRGQRSATVTYNVTFDPQGREIARGIVQDRRAPAGQFGKCLGQLRTPPFSISPPGTYVTLRVPVAYP